MKIIIGLFIAVVLAAIVESGGLFIIETIIPMLLAIAFIYSIWFSTSVLAFHYRRLQKERRQRFIRNRMIIQLNRENNG